MAVMSAPQLPSSGRQLADAPTHASAAPPADASQPLHGGGEIEALLERFLVSIMALAGAQAGAVRVKTDDHQHLRLLAARGLPEQLICTEQLVGRDCGVCGVAAGADSLVWLDDTQTCARNTGHAWFGKQCRRVLAISLVHGKDVVGAYSLFFDTQVRLAPATESMLRQIGQVLGLALHNARLERERTRMTVLRERQEMVNEVHDAIAQTLAYANMRLPLLNKAMLAHDDRLSVKYFGDVKRAVGEVHHNLREVMTYFRTRMDPLGLLHALHGIADEYRDRNGISLEIRSTVQSLNLDDEQEVQVFHIVQEALANIAKHSKARHAVVRIDRMPQALVFLIEDDGQGLAATYGQADASPVTKQLGLDIMQARARRLGARIDVGVAPLGGTRVRLEVPTVPVGEARP
jgi:two-component system nitrate/nitrite sensor histidine kinase NarX